MTSFPTTSPVGRTDAISRAFRTNAEFDQSSNMSDPSTINPGDATKQGPRTFMDATDSMGEKLSRMYYELGMKAAAAAFTPVKPPTITAPKPQSAGQVGTERAQAAQLNPPSPPRSALTAPQTAFKPPTLQMPPSPVTSTQQMMSARQGDVTQHGAAIIAKSAGFNMGLTAPPKPKPGEIAPNNTDFTPGTNFNDPSRPDRRIGAAFDSFRSQKNQDFLNEGNEGTLGFPGV